MPTIHDMSWFFFSFSSDIESSKHLFYSYHFSYNVWSIVNNLMSIQGVKHNEGVQQLFMRMNLVLNKRLTRTCFLIWLTIVGFFGWVTTKLFFKKGLQVAI